MHRLRRATLPALVLVGAVAVVCLALGLAAGHQWEAGVNRSLVLLRDAGRHPVCAGSTYNETAPAVARCLVKHGFISNAKATELSQGAPLVPWWAPFDVLPAAATVVAWVLVTVLETIGVVALLRRRGRTIPA